jgi:lactate 2-monooxygenase
VRTEFYSEVDVGSNKVYRPRSNNVMFSILGRAKAADFTALVITLDTFSIGWRPHDLETAHLPFHNRVGIRRPTQWGHPVRPDERPSFPLDLEAFRRRGEGGGEARRWVVPGDGVGSVPDVVGPGVLA